MEKQENQQMILDNQSTTAMHHILIPFAVACMIFLWIARRLRISKYHERYVFITGCDTGFGNLLAKRLDSLGVNVFVGCLTLKGKEDLQRSTSSQVTVLSLDVTNHDSIVEARKVVESRLPEGKGLWGLVNNAGIGGSSFIIDWLKVEDFKKCNSVNLYGMIDVTIEFLPLLITARGRIVNITSMMGRIAASTAPYVVSKFGAEGFCDCLRRELYKTGVTVHILEPGYFQTGIAKFDNPEDRKRFLEVDPKRRDYYGPNYLEKYFLTKQAAVDKIISPNVSLVVDSFVHALTAKYPKTRYVVGWYANTYFRFLWTVPDWLSDYIMTRNNYAPQEISKQK